MALKLVEAAKSEPVLLGDVKAFLRVDEAADDTVIDGLIAACRQEIEHRTDLALLSQTWDEAFDVFPCGDEPIKLSRSPVTEVVSIKYLDDDGVEQTMPVSDYRVDAISSPARITPAYGLSWPSAQRVTNAVTVRFKAGYLKPADVPAWLRNVLKATVLNVYDNREVGVSPDFSAALDLALANYKIYA